MLRSIFLRDTKVNFATFYKFRLHFFNVLIFKSLLSVSFLFVYGLMNVVYSCVAEKLLDWFVYC